MTPSDRILDLFFATKQRVGRQLVERCDAHGRSIFGPFRDRRKTDTGLEYSYRDVTADLIERHVTGELLYRGERARLQTYGVAEDLTARWVTIDLDVTADGAHSEQPQHFPTTDAAVAAAKCLIAELCTLGCSSFMEVTKSLGDRIRVFFSAAVEAADANALGRLVVKRAGLHPSTEVFPNSLRPFSSPVLLPYAGVAPKGRQVFVHHETLTPIPIADFLQVAWSTRSAPDDIRNVVGVAVANGEVQRLPERTGTPSGEFQPIDDADADRKWSAVLEGCHRLRHLVDRALAGERLGYGEWALQLAPHLKAFGEWGHREFHRLSAFDSRYREDETEDVFDSLCGSPTRCEKMACGRNPQKDCGMPARNVSASYFAARSATGIEPAVANVVRRQFPAVDQSAYHGLAGDIVRAIEPHTEADSVALLIQFLVAYGNAIGRQAHFRAEADSHYGNLFAVLVGVSSKGRKGSSWGHVKRLFEVADPMWVKTRVVSGLSTGEGLIHHVRDPFERSVRDKKTGSVEPVVEDEGVSDKRLLVMESEFASVLRQTQRDGNTLSATCRNAWDTGDLQSLTKNSPARASGGHISIMGHITQDELRKELAETETANGFGNRFLWVSVRRSKELPDGGRIDTVDFSEINSRLKAAIEHGQKAHLLERDPVARRIWHEIYGRLSAGKPGQRGALTGRSEAQTMRLALLYALLDGETAIRGQHLQAALALWDYCDECVGYIFGDSLGDRVADAILAGLRDAPNGMSREQIRDRLGRNQTSARIDQALSLLLEYSLAHATREGEGPGRRAEVWRATRFTTETR